MTTILLTEDTQELALALRNNLEIEGYEVILAADGEECLTLARSGKPDLIILDLMLPRLDGFRALKALRAEGSLVPVLILTARGDESDKVRGLKMGADDYVTKPFGLLELMARVEGLLRRSVIARTETGGVRFGDVLVNWQSHVVSRNGVEVPLTPKEFDLLSALLSKDNTAISRFDLMQRVWGYADSVISRTVDTHIAELRRKLEPKPREPQHILTVPRIGYRLKR